MTPSTLELVDRIPDLIVFALRNDTFANILWVLYLSIWTFFTRKKILGSFFKAITGQYDTWNISFEA